MSIDFEVNIPGRARRTCRRDRRARLGANSWAHRMRWCRLLFAHVVITQLNASAIARLTPDLVILTPSATTSCCCGGRPAPRETPPLPPNLGQSVDSVLHPHHPPTTGISITIRAGHLRFAPRLFYTTCSISTARAPLSPRRSGKCPDPRRPRHVFCVGTPRASCGHSKTG